MIKRRPVGAHRRPEYLQKLLIALLLIVLGPSAIPVAAQYVLTPIDDLNAASPVLGAPPYTQAHGINDAGVVVGVYSGANNTFHGFQYIAGAITTIDIQGPCSFACGTEPNGINNSGVVVGDYTDSAGFTHGYSSAGGSLTTIDFPGAALTLALGINNSGVIVGFYVDNNNIEHGFKYSNGTIAPIAFPGGSFFSAESINDAGDIVGRCVGSVGGVYACKFTAATGQATPLASLGVTISDATGINNAGQIVGNSSSGQFLLSGGNFTALSCPLSGCAWRILSIDNAGKIAGVYTLNQLEHGFLASTVELLDPVPDLLSGPSVTTNAAQLAAKGTPVLGVAADGVTQIVLRITATNVGDQFTVTLFNDQGLSGQNILPNEDGALGKPGDASFSLRQTTITAQNTVNGPMAFAIYRAPLDFARQISTGDKLGVCNGVTDTDDHLACRGVSVQVQDVTAGGVPITIPITIVRPPVVLIHGLWSTQEETWNNFSPLYSLTGSDPRFYVTFANYSYPVGDLIAITSVNPPFTGPISFVFVNTSTMHANSLGFQFNAPWVLSQLSTGIIGLKLGKNPLGIPIAAVQADVVGHSMGGVITRTMALQSLAFNFLRDDNYAQGDIHKLITVDTPHLGSPLPTAILAAENNCVRSIFAAVGNFAVNTVTISSGTVYSGAVGDLQGDGTGASLSPALAVLTQPGSHPLPTALIAGVASSANYSSLSNSLKPAHVILTKLCGQDPLGILFNSSTAWPSVFNNQESDAVVPFSSEVIQTAFGPTYQFTRFDNPGRIHSVSFLQLGFTGPTVVDAGDVPTRVIQLLNTPVTQSDFNLLNP